MAVRREYIDLLFDAGPGPVAGRFVEANGPDGASILAGEWLELPNGMWRLRVTPTAFLAKGNPYCCYLREYDGRGCTNGADWEIQGQHFEDNTFACTEHLGEMVDPTKLYELIPVEQA